MLADIEKNIIARLKAKGLQAAFGITRDALGGLVTPAVYCAIEEASFKKTTQVVFKQNIKVFLTVIFDNIRAVEDRRKGIYLIIEGVIAHLMLQSVGLEIDPLMPAGFRNITSEDDMDLGRILFQIEFHSGYEIRKSQTDEEAAAPDLITIGLNYFLQDPVDDGVVDASDTVTTVQGG